MGCPLDRLQLALEGKIDIFKKTWPWGSVEDEHSESPKTESKKWSIEDTGPYKGPPDATGLFLFLSAKAAESESQKKASNG